MSQGFGMEAPSRHHQTALREAAEVDLLKVQACAESEGPA